MLKNKAFHVVRHIQLSGKIRFSLGGIELFPVFNVIILGMVKEQVFRMQLFCKLAGVFYSRMMLFVRLENVLL